MATDQFKTLSPTSAAATNQSNAASQMNLGDGHVDGGAHVEGEAANDRGLQTVAAVGATNDWLL
jgi:hypothetical protein